MPIGILTPPFVGVYGPRPYEAKKEEKAMQITDEMVEAAWGAFESGDNMRAALEAALNQKCDGDLVNRLRNRNPALGISENGVPPPITEQAADCIKDLAGALHRIEKWEGGPIDQGANGSRDYFRELARATLGRWGSDGRKTISDIAREFSISRRQVNRIAAGYRNDEGF